MRGQHGAELPRSVLLITTMSSVVPADELVPGLIAGPLNQFELDVLRCLPGDVLCEMSHSQSTRRHQSTVQIQTQHCPVLRHRRRG